MNELTNSVNAGILPGSAVAAIDAEVIRPILQAVGSSKAADLTSDEAFKIGDFEPEEEPQPPPIIVPGQAVEQPEEIPSMEAVQAVASNYVRGLIEKLQEQREPFIPAGASEPVLGVPADVEITDMDIQQAMALFDKMMPELRGMLDTQEVTDEQVYDGTQY